MDPTPLEDQELKVKYLTFPSLNGMKLVFGKSQFGITILFGDKKPKAQFVLDKAAVEKLKEFLNESH